MRMFIGATLALAIGLFAQFSPANAAGLGSLKFNGSQEVSQDLLVPVHSGGMVFDQLTDYGYKKLRLVKEYHDYRGKPIFKFKACRKGRIYFLKVNWYGDVISKSKRGLCAFRIR